MQRADALLTASEKRVLHALAQGLSTKEIALSLHISEHTAARHRKNICKKLSLHSTAELVLFAANFSERSEQTEK